MIKKTLQSIILVLAASTLFSCSEKSPTEPEVARVGDVPILLKDFEKEISLAYRRDPTMKITPVSVEDLLEGIIDKRLLLREAVERGLSEDERFIETIKAYWEQTLIRELINARMEELGKETFVTEEEARRHWERMQHKITVRTANAGSVNEAEEVQRVMLAGEVAPGEEKVGPLFADDIPMSSPLYEAFDMTRGEARILKGRSAYTVVVVVEKEPVRVAPYEEAGEIIKGYLIGQKRQKAFDDWVESLRESTPIRIDRETLGKVGHE